MSQERASVACLVETKMNVMTRSHATQALGAAFDYICQPTAGYSGGILVAWDKVQWAVNSRVREFSISIELQSLTSAEPQWTLIVVYGPVVEARKAEFLAKLWNAHQASGPAVLLLGDFNLIYEAANKNNDRLCLSSMRRFRLSLDAMGVQELYLHGRVYTWSNEGRHPTLERLDRAFTSVQWLQLFVDQDLRALPSDASDHAPLLL